MVLIPDTSLTTTIMATVTYYIRSHYDADKHRESLLEQTGQNDPEQEEPDPWQTEKAAFGPNRFATAPAFVPAVISYEAVNETMGSYSQTETTVVPAQSQKSEIAGWYRSLDRQKPIPPVKFAPKPSTSKPRTTSHDWFIANAIQSLDTPPQTHTPPTLADILHRDPPSKKSHAPPVWTTIGPSNRGFAMLQNSGWREGEALGSSIARRSDHPPKGQVKEVREVKLEVECDGFDDIIELRTKTEEVIDLTWSDESSESSSEEEDNILPTAGPTSLAHGGKALLTPIPTVLKSDRLGIGLKAKTFGPYKASQKRVTHNAAALSAHLQANEHMRQLKAKVGRGSRGFAKVSKREAANRKNLLAYLNE